MYPNLLGKPFFYALVGFVALDLLSLATFFTPVFFSATLWVLAGAVLVLALFRLDFAILVLCAELFVGAKGQWFFTSIQGVSISMRLLFFLAVFLGWIVWLLRRRAFSLRRSPVFWWLIAFAGVVILGVVNGVLQGNAFADVFFDANGYFYLAVAPAFITFLRTREQRERLLQILGAATVFLFFKGLILLAVFSHQYQSIPELYRWVRDTRMYEITAIGKNFYRIFSQGQLYSLLGVLVFLGLGLLGEKGGGRRIAFTLAFFGWTTILLSFSRSFWLALVVTLPILCILLYRFGRWPLSRFVRLGGWFLLSIIASVVVISFVANYPYLLNRPGGEQTLALLGERSTELQESAVVSRYALVRPMTIRALEHPIIGAGLGTTLTFVSQDPRAIQETGGTRTTYAFEWGYLDFFLKFGIIGVIVIVGLCFLVARHFYRLLQWSGQGHYQGLILGLFLASLSLYVTHATSPYLNHPLGIGFLLILIAFIGPTKDQPLVLDTHSQ